MSAPTLGEHLRALEAELVRELPLGALVISRIIADYAAAHPEVGEAPPEDREADVNAGIDAEIAIRERATKA